MSEVIPMNGPAETDETIFAAALECPTTAAQAALLDRACVGDPARRQRDNAGAHCNERNDANAEVHDAPTQPLVVEPKRQRKEESM